VRTILFPGFSPKNKAWAEEIQRGLLPTHPTTVIKWLHWETGAPRENWVEEEAQKLGGVIQGEPFNIIAKSIGTVVSMLVLKANPKLINKIILCGIPMRDLLEEDKRCYKALIDFSPQKLLCVQNENDNHGSYEEIVLLLHSLNPDIKIVSKPRADHEYPYIELFLEFLNT